MESPAKGEPKQGLKGTQKHLEFQLQREKGYTRELEEKIKTQQAQIAKLEQDKAELRRENITLADDDKKRNRLEERCHTLQRDISEKQSALIAEQKRATKAECEKEQVRRDAQASIAKWCEAEKQWVKENESLQKELDESKSAHMALSEEYKGLLNSQKELQKQLEREKEHSSRLEELTESSEKKIAMLHSRIEGLQNDVHTRDETIFKLDEAGSKWQEMCHAKDNEIKSLEVQIGMQSGTIEKLQNTISALNQQMEAVKFLGIEEKGRSEKVKCDLREMEKERNLLQMELETVRRDFEHASQNASKHQELITELRGKLLTSSELVKEKSAEVRKHELTISELTAEVKRIERERTESNHSITTMEGQLQNLRDTLECTRMAMEKTNGINAALEGELQQVKMSQESKDETLVVLRAEYEEKLEVLLCETKNLESEINARQIVIGNLTNQLTEANVANEALFNKVTQSTDCSARLRSSLEKMQICNCDLERRIFFNDEAIARIALQNCWLEENCGIYCDRTATAERSSLYSLTEKNLLNRNLQESIAEKEVTALRLSDVQLLLEKKRIESVEEARRILEVCEERERTIVILQEEVACSAGELLFLKEELLRQKVCVEQLAANERLLAGKLSDTEELLRVTTASSAERAELSRWASEWIGRSIHFCANLVEQCDALMTDKLYHMVMVLTEVYDKRNKETYSALRLLEDAQRNAEEARLHAELKLSEIESRAANGVELLKKQKEDFLSKIRCVEKQKEEADSEIKSLVQKISELKERHSGDMKEKDSKIEELVHAVSTEKSRVQHLEEKMAKLHKKLEYELLRKAEYKEALEIVKAKREETDRYRATEKDLAMKAVDVANKEINYWVRSFEQLKGMLQDLSRRSGTQIAPADQEKIREMEDAVCRMSTRDTNLPKCSPEGRNGSQKRPRTEL